jgi:hypothetical protein
MMINVPQTDFRFVPGFLLCTMPLISEYSHTGNPISFQAAPSSSDVRRCGPCEEALVECSNSVRETTTAIRAVDKELEAPCPSRVRALA